MSGRGHAMPAPNATIGARPALPAPNATIGARPALPAPDDAMSARERILSVLLLVVALLFLT
ncbi:MAG TPA: hypothetical protein VNE71_12375, partial [Myxococcota bacterium]|nr:hypothetical protein [Myxococcota bacterium]